MQTRPTPRRRNERETTQTRPMDPLLTVSEVAAMLKIHRSTVYALMTQGLPTVKFSGMRRIQQAALQTWIEQHSQQ